MNLPYMLNAAIMLVACLVFYKLLLQRETFYKVNRYVLIACLAISFTLPLLQVPPGFSLRKTSGVNSEWSMVNGNQPILDDVSSPAGNEQQTTDNSTTGKATDAKSSAVNSDQKTGNIYHSQFTIDRLISWIFWLYWFGVIVFGINFLFQVVVLLWRSLRNPVIMDGPFRIVEVSGDKAPCSFGNAIFINPAKYDWDTYSQILEHEKIHIRERHTLDILFAELVLIFQWFNPFAWIYPRDRKQPGIPYRRPADAAQHR